MTISLNWYERNRFLLALKVLTSFRSDEDYHEGPRVNILAKNANLSSPPPGLKILIFSPLPHPKNKTKNSQPFPGDEMKNHFMCYYIPAPSLLALPYLPRSLSRWWIIYFQAFEPVRVILVWTLISVSCRDTSELCRGGGLGVQWLHSQKIWESSNEKTQFLALWASRRGFWGLYIKFWKIAMQIRNFQHFDHLWALIFGMGLSKKRWAFGRGSPGFWTYPGLPSLLLPSQPLHSLPLPSMPLLSLPLTSLPLSSLPLSSLPLSSLPFPPLPFPLYHFPLCPISLCPFTPCAFLPCPFPLYPISIYPFTTCSFPLGLISPISFPPSSFTTCTLPSLPLPSLPLPYLHPSLFAPSLSAPFLLAPSPSSRRPFSPYFFPRNFGVLIYSPPPPGGAAFGQNIYPWETFIRSIYSVEL